MSILLCVPDSLVVDAMVEVLLSLHPNQLSRNLHRHLSLLHLNQVTQSFEVVPTAAAIRFPAPSHHQSQLLLSLPSPAPIQR